MTRLVRVLGMVALVATQEPAAPAASQRNEIDIVHHLANSHTLEVPSFRPPYYKEVDLPQFTPFRVGRLEIDLSPTRHVVFLVLAAVLVGLVFLYTSRAVARAHAQGHPPRGFPAAMEAMALYIRQEVILPNVGPHGEGYVNYLLTVFFFILTCNLLGLLPWSATPTANIAVTGAMAFVSLAVIEISGMRALGVKGDLGTIFYLPHGLPAALKPAMLVIMTPIEIIGKRSEEHTSELQSQSNLVCRLLLEKKKR